MNPIYRQAGETAQHTWVMGMMTVAFLVFFVGWVLWAWAPFNRQLMKDAGAMPLDDGGEA